jgi:hypothetical protein
MPSAAAPPASGTTGGAAGGAGGQVVAQGGAPGGARDMEGVESSADSGLRDVAVQMLQAMSNTPVDVAAQWAAVIAHLCSGTGRAAILTGLPPTGEAMKAQGARPLWAAGGDDKRAALHWDTSQTVANCTVNGKHTLAVVDTGSYKTIMDLGTARMLGLAIREAKNGDCGTYSVPGTG